MTFYRKSRYVNNNKKNQKLQADTRSLDEIDNDCSLDFTLIFLHISVCLAFSSIKIV